MNEPHKFRNATRLVYTLTVLCLVGVQKPRQPITADM